VVVVVVVVVFFLNTMWRPREALPFCLMMIAIGLLELEMRNLVWK
jgi:hypothetical protein